jgi:hypothetical protein
VTIFKGITGLLAVAACLVAAGCGSDEEGEPIPAETANALQSRLNEIERRFDFGNGACADIENDSRPAVNQLIASMPDNVDADVREALQEGFNRLFRLNQEQCDQEQQSETDTETVPVPEPQPEPEPTTTVTVPPETTETTPPETETDTAPPETDEQVPPGQGGDVPGGGQGGNGNGQGGSGSGQGGSGQGGQGGGGGNGLGGSGGGALVPEDQG